MPRIAIIVAAALVGVVVLIFGQGTLTADRAVAELAAVEATGDLESRMRLCVGPARVTFGGEPYIGLAFGGDGCDHSAADLVGFRILRSPAGSPGTVTDAVLEMFGAL
jgi:hypothetical protein